ncbi:MAG: molybdenum ABC transporter ATP-binding protein [Paenibacillaceae bacterium ZCTH02-B3]|nr:MAG: molybdenum ABC transporter ATP-binding protein [Paenibacillaceae bacterium ZCTH02-B3]
MIHLHQLTWRREDRQILKGVDLHIGKGERWVLLGRNGCGKTTVLEMICGYLFPTTGRVEVLGHVYGTVDLRELRKRIGYIGPSLVEKFTLRDPVWEIVAGGLFAYLRIYEKVDDEVYRRALEELARVRLKDKAHQPFGTLSQGERKKALLARTMMANPDLLILDEPCAGLDPYEREKFLEALGEMARGDLTILYVTHHVEEIVPLFTHVALMADGWMLAAGPKREVLTPEALGETYGLTVSITWEDGRPWMRVGKPVRQGAGG